MAYPAVSLFNYVTRTSDRIQLAFRTSLFPVSREMLNNSYFVFTIGKTGKKGNDGAQGPPGQTGEKGDKGHGVSGVNYVRWGRTECPGNATLVYSGKREII